jgi:hypothetical protein
MRSRTRAYHRHQFFGADALGIEGRTVLGTLFDVTNDKKIRPNRETQSVPNHKHRDSGNVCFQHGAHALESALHGNENARLNEQASITYTALGTKASSHAKEQMHADTKTLMFHALDHGHQRARMA